jgi:hypothetical protein
MRTGEVKAPPAVETQATYQVKVEGGEVLVSVVLRTAEVKEESKELPSSKYKLVLLERQVFEGTDILTSKLSKQVQDQDKRTLEYLAGQFAF